jgi:hypothetical protein
MYLIKKTLSLKFKESTTIVFRKNGKKNYSLLNSYKSIALENMLAKILEKAVANRLNRAAEEYTLLPWNQMSARKERSTLSAIGLITLYI